MRMLRDFKKLEEEASDSDSVEGLYDEIEIVGEIPAVESDITLSDGDLVEYADDVDNDSDFDPNAIDSDDSMSDDGSEKVIKNTEDVRNSDDAMPSTSVDKRFTSKLLGEAEEDDETVRAIIAAIKKPRSSPPEIKLDDFVTDICFHPERDIIALGTITGDVYLYKYSNEENLLLRTIEIHAKSCRDVEFTDDGRNLLTCSKDKSIMITDMETEKLKAFYETAHDDAINKLHVIDAHLFASGDDDGTVKLWDLRTKYAIFALKEVEQYISQLLTNDDKKLLLFTSGDAYLSTINIGARKLYVQSEPYEEDFTCMGLYRGDSKLVVGSSKGRLYTYDWGQFGYHCDMFPGLKTPIGAMIPITDRIGCVAGEEGIIRACHIAPFRNLGIVGQHSMPVETLDINCSGELIASSSHNNDVRFWNIKYFEEYDDIKYNEKHNANKSNHHNLPSSKCSNASDFFADLAKEQSDGD